MNRSVLAALAVTLTLTVSACGSSDKDTADGETDAGQDRQQAALDFSQCMRDNGIDMPDPQFDGKGGAMMRMGKDDAINPESPEFQEAQEKCEKEFEDVIGPGDDRSPEEQQEFQDKMIEYAQCMRDNGVDMQDPQFDDKGRVTMRAGGDGATGNGPDDDEEFEAAQEKCRDKDPMPRGGTLNEEDGK
jgi:hypothetical protein